MGWRIGDGFRNAARAAALACALAALAPAAAGATQQAALGDLPGDPAVAEPMTDMEVSSVGCVIAAAGVGFATVAAGGVALAATGVGAASTAVAVPVVVATMAGGCTLGAAAAPAFLWAKRHGHTVTSTVTGAVAALWPGPSR